MREQLEAVEARARRAEELLPDSAELQGRLEGAEQQLQRWRVILEGAADCATPEDVLHTLNRLQQQQMEATVQASQPPNQGDRDGGSGGAHHSGAPLVWPASSQPAAC